MAFYVYKTDIDTFQEFLQFKKLLNEQMNLKLWSIDLEDADKVLKVSADKKKSEFETLLQIRSSGINCELLDD